MLDKGEGLQTYGYYPFYLMREKGNLLHINYIRTSNAIDIIKEESKGEHYLTYKIIGGILISDFL